MALVAHSGLPAFASMADEGVSVVTPAQATASGRADVDVGLLNLMPDTALRATDRQFVRLLSAAARDIDVWVYPFTVAEEHRGAEARQHIASHYLDFGDVKGRGLDALVVTGANPTQHDLEQEHFWDGLSDVLDWATVSTRSVLCSCLATHAVLHKYLGKTRTRLPRKRWGVYSHRVLADHPLLAGIGGPVEAPHSHWYDVTREEMEAVGLTVILESDEAGVHMAVDDQDFYVFFQGHPEYDLVSLLKEYRRELGRYYRGERADYPPVPEHYFDAQALARIEEYRPVLEAAKAAGLQPPGLPEERLLPRESHTWSRDGQVIFSNWLHRIVGESPG